MKTIVAGSRGIVDYDEIALALDGLLPAITTVVSGHAQGVDRLGEHWAKQRGIEVEVWPAEWGKYGKSAGYRRNVDMAMHAEALVAFWDGKSRGTKHMIDIAKDRGLSVTVFQWVEQTEH